jgi:rRNA-processing protein FCF1
MKILMDTNFILACIKQKIDFVNAEDFFNEKVEWIIPHEVLDELKVLKDRKETKISDRNAAKMSFEILNLIKPEIVQLKNPNVDKGIADYISGKDIVLATLDKELKKKVKNKILTIRGKKKLEVL